MNASPWAVKKINRCANKQVSVYQKRLNAEAKVLKGINHPNIVGTEHTSSFLTAELHTWSNKNPGKLLSHANG